MDIINIGSRREVCWDEALIDKADNMQIKMHKPQYRGEALVCNKPWEGNNCIYFNLVHDKDVLRLYYLGTNGDVNEDGTATVNAHHPMVCTAVSYDNMTFQRISVGKHTYEGITENNILVDYLWDNMFVFIDTNPACAPEARFKGLADRAMGLCLFESADGVHFEEKRVLADDGSYDSLNVCFWDEDIQAYRLYYRGIHGAGSVDGKWAEGEGTAMHTTGLRDIRLRTSKDFVHWSEPQMLQYGDSEDLEMYTNNVQKYYRAPHMFLGMPTRYLDRVDEPASFPHLPDYEHRQRYIRHSGRTGTVMTDACLMTSRDGLNFRRTDEAFLTPGPQTATNWYYGDGYPCYGMVETPSPIPGEPDELSLFMPVNHCTTDAVLRRYALRIDGFFSWNSGFKGGTVITKPITFAGNKLSLNFATSGSGFIRVRILDADGNAIDGYDSGNHFGDTLDRQIAFEKPLADLSGKPVRLEFTLKDAHLYSFQFA